MMHKIGKSSCLVEVENFSSTDPTRVAVRSIAIFDWSIISLCDFFHACNPCSPILVLNSSL